MDWFIHWLVDIGFNIFFDPERLYTITPAKLTLEMETVDQSAIDLKSKSSAPEREPQATTSAKTGMDGYDLIIITPTKCYWQK